MDLFTESVKLGRKVLYLHTFGERMQEGQLASSSGTPRMAPGTAPTVVTPIPSNSAEMPNTMTYEAATQSLHVGGGVIEHVTQAMRDYNVSGVNVLDRWFSSRRQDRTKPIIGERRVSDLLKIQPDHWLPEYTKSLIDVLNLLGLLVQLERDQAAYLDLVMAGPLIQWQRADISGRSRSTSVQDAVAAEHGQVAFDGFDG